MRRASNEMYEMAENMIARQCRYMYQVSATVGHVTATVRRRGDDEEADERVIHEQCGVQRPSHMS